MDAVPATTCSAADVGPSGMDGTCQLTVAGGLANGVGTFSFTATAKDMAGNVATKTGAGYYWRIGVKLDDNTIQSVNIGLR